MKRILTFVLVAMMIMALAVPTFAAGETGSITVTNPIEGQTYDAYQMASFDHYTDGKYTYTVLDEWKAFFAQYPNDFAISEDNKLVLEEGANLDAAVFAKAALAYAQTNEIDATGTGALEGENETVVIPDLPVGYYLVDSSVGAFCGLTNVTPNEGNVEEKNDVPTVDKFVEEDSKVDNGIDDDDWGKNNDADLFQTINYKTIVTVKKGAVNYVLHDSMTEGLTWDGTVTVTVNGETVAADDATYTLDADPEDDCTFDIVFADEYVGGLDHDTEIVVTYTAHLNENAKIADETNDNETWLDYGEDKNTTHITTKTSVFKFDFVKTDADGNLLDGAEFELLATEDSDVAINLIKIEDGVYRRAAEGEENIETTIITKDGKATIIGLDGTTDYYLKETEAPEGYNKLTAPKKVELLQTNILTEKNDESGEWVGIQIINKTGAQLPETGGFGTTMFIIIGGAIVLGAGVLLFAKKRMSQIAE